MPNPKYTFQERVAVSRWHDGDTFYGVLDQGVGIFRGGGLHIDPVSGEVIVETIRMRCALIQAPELTVDGKMNPRGQDALNYAKFLIIPGVYSCVTYKADDVFDRPLVDVMLPNGNLFSTEMLNAGHAVPYK